MITTDITSLEQQPQKGISSSLEALSSLTGQKTLFILKLLEYLLAAAFVCAGIVLTVYADNKNLLISGIIALTILSFLFLFNRQLFQDSQNTAYRYSIIKKAELYSYLLNNSNSVFDSNQIVPAREKALQYCQDLIDDYKKARNLSRNLYYVLQISTVILSGITPILVLVDKLEAGQAWLKWLPVICPAIASIVASIVTSFPFQKNWVAANTTLELLEAEQEKFILGVTPAYRCYDLSDTSQQQQKASQAIEQFIVQVNNIHLQQVQQASEVQQEKKESEKTNTNNSETDDKS
ncbi:conserved hypothetical protein [Trichormus variabilis ATCC 29413]|uniref:DUF4231 domain-containing protein n=2 Tax=Anabaena variabilis TaxID=264691 RepID=Q3M8V2_TRIV2|nr:MULTISPECIES: DUF4231 domain-containing protein [Nostocaceae]ABA22584.1 conserved hypothetical protein [Trichormus variabilis ATCC 29413]MBC1217118.1 DUF4231 domain-containing protein [Trichormus variabilis ARAD]MBC1256715.1 DUF4231 domain-containing protein [Trichormus variabilis V5]MBC1269957.1 DUF4231 domain-containing protein [Trichormus variabilis FSR]MBC1305221.1 DUF4231 domain-containing protein [Trichormus variabilis N2B]